MIYLIEMYLNTFENEKWEKRRGMLKIEEMRNKIWYNSRLNWNIVCWHIVFSKIRQDENSFNDISHKFLYYPFHFLINFLTMYTYDIISFIFLYIVLASYLFGLDVIVPSVSLNCCNFVPRRINMVTKQLKP